MNKYKIDPSDKNKINQNKGDSSRPKYTERTDGINRNQLDIPIENCSPGK
jgi:hypothetical protein